jgi:hypothetical protein
LAFVFILILAGLVSGQSADLKRLQEQARRERVVDRDVKPLTGQVFKMEDLCEVRLRKGRIDLRPTFPHTSPHQVQVEGISDPVVVYRYNNLLRQATDFRIVSITFSDPVAVSIETQMTWTANLVNIHRTTRLVNGYRYIGLVQTVGDSSGAGRGCILTVTDESDRGVSNSQTFDAMDFSSLRRKYPGPVSLYLRPVLCDLQFHAALAAEATLAWQVFSAEYQPPKATVEELHALLPQLNSASLDEREAASEKLAGLGRDAALYILQLDRSRFTPEQNARLDAQLVPYGILPTAQRKRLRDDANFLADCLYSDDARIVEAALKHLRGLTRKEIALDASLPPHKRSGVVEPLRKAAAKAAD